MLNWRNQLNVSGLYSVHLRIQIGEKSRYHNIDIPQKIGLRPEVRLAFKKLVAQGWTDAIRKLYPHERCIRFGNTSEMHIGGMQVLRIDHFLLSPQLKGKLVDAGVDRHVRGWEKTSDHAPVWIELAESNLASRKKKKVLE